MSLSCITLSSGRSIELTQLRMSTTYGGMLEGYPCRLINDRMVSGLLRRAEKAFSFAPVHPIPPSRAYPDQTAGAFGPVEVLPSVACIGVFGSAAVDPELDAVLHRSTLVVAWFQATPDVPSDENADPALRAIAWDELAKDYEL
ncbi:hypothetical protein ACGFYE_39370 [Streptomyces zaomyceticus]|uniref:hypothetical protein n=1 Tax=Streptomyces zaomyceticus TaxID=68286 RepID=UPI0037237037